MQHLFAKFSCSRLALVLLLVAVNPQVGHGHLVYLKNILQSIYPTASDTGMMAASPEADFRQLHHWQQHQYEHHDEHPDHYDHHHDHYQQHQQQLSSSAGLHSAGWPHQYSTIKSTYEKLYPDTFSYLVYGPPSQPKAPAVGQTTIPQSSTHSQWPSASYVVAHESSPLYGHSSYASLALPSTSKPVFVRPPTHLMLAPDRTAGAAQSSQPHSQPVWQQQPRQPKSGQKPGEAGRTEGTQRYIDICMVTTTGAYAVPTDPAGVQPFCPY